jgi:hypothetical protein
MDFTLNELSLRKLANNQEAIKVFMELSDVASALSSIGFRAMKIWNKSEFLTFQFTDEITLVAWLKQPKFETNLEKMKSQKLKSIISKKDSIWNDEEITLIVNCPIIGIQLHDSQKISEGLKIACLFNTIAVSFQTEPFWDRSFIELIHISEDDNNNILEQIITVNHASSKTHIDEKNNWLSSLLLKKLIGKEWKPSENLFPNIDFSNQLVKDEDWSNFYTERDAAKNAYERLAIIIDIGKKVAARNQYYPDKKVSDLNTTKTNLRIVFGAGTDKDRIYLSIDLEKGGFEVCNYLGEHLGEYFFDGVLQSGKKNGHNLKIKS